MTEVLELPDRKLARVRVATEVRVEIARAGLNQSKMQSLTGIPQSTLSRKLKARTESDSFTVDELDRIATALRVPIETFFGVRLSGHPGPDGDGVRPKGFEPLTF